MLVDSGVIQKLKILLLILNRSESQKLTMLFPRILMETMSVDLPVSLKNLKSEKLFVLHAQKI